MAPSTTGREGKHDKRKAGTKAVAKKGASDAKAAKPKKPKKAKSPTAREIEIDEEILEFIEAIDRFRKDTGKPFPTWSEVFHVLRSLGYRRVS